MRFFFDLIDSDGHTVDEEGVELPDADHAAREAAKILAEVALHKAHFAKWSRVELCCAVRSQGALITRQRLTIDEIPG